MPKQKKKTLRKIKDRLIHCMKEMNDIPEVKNSRAKLKETINFFERELASMKRE